MIKPPSPQPPNTNSSLALKRPGFPWKTPCFRKLTSYPQEEVDEGPQRSAQGTGLLTRGSRLPDTPGPVRAWVCSYEPLNRDPDAYTDRTLQLVFWWCPFLCFGVEKASHVSNGCKMEMFSGALLKHHQKRSTKLIPFDSSGDWHWED